MLNNLLKLVFLLKSLIFKKFFFDNEEVLFVLNGKYIQYIIYTFFFFFFFLTHGINEIITLTMKSVTDLKTQYTI